MTERLIFDNVRELVANIEQGDDRQPFLVRHRKVDHYVLAADDVEALAIVFREKSSAEVGPVALDEIMTAMREIATAEAQEAATAEAQEAATKKKPAAKKTTKKPADKTPADKTPADDDKTDKGDGAAS